MTAQIRKFVFSNLQSMVEDWDKLNDEDVAVYLGNLMALVGLPKGSSVEEKRVA